MNEYNKSKYYHRQDILKRGWSDDEIKLYFKPLKKDNDLFDIKEVRAAEVYIKRNLIRDENGKTNSR